MLVAVLVGGGARVVYQQFDRSAPTPAPSVSAPAEPTRPMARDEAAEPDLDRPGRAGRALSGVTIALDPGHNGGNADNPATVARSVDAGGFRKACDTTGAQTADGSLTEARFNLDVALRLRRLLKQSGARVVMTRTGNGGVGPCIDRRAGVANDAGADVALSVHADGGPPDGRGFHVIHPRSIPGLTDDIAGPSLRLARKVRSRLREIGLADSSYAGRAGIDARRDIGGLNLSAMPKVLVELGNMRNASEARRLKDPSHRTRLASGLAAAVRDFAGE